MLSIDVQKLEALSFLTALKPSVQTLLRIAQVLQALKSPIVMYHIEDSQIALTLQTLQ